MKYKSYRIINGKPRWVIVDENGNIVNRNPTEDELKELKKLVGKIHERYTEEQLLNELRRFEKALYYLIAIDKCNKIKYAWRVPGE